jgi:hypothetical protein
MTSSAVRVRVSKKNIPREWSAYAPSGMQTLPEFREPSEEERRLLERLLEAEFPGRDELAPLLRAVRVRAVEERVGLQLESQVAGRAPVVQAFPVEAEGKDEDGAPIHVRLVVLNGRPSALHYYREDAVIVKKFPPASSFELIVRPPVPKGRPKSPNIDPRVPPPETELVDFAEHGAHVPWVVANPTEFALARHRESSTAKLLHFSVTKNEWDAIHAEVFGWEPNQHITEPQKTEARNFPRLSGIGSTESALFERSQIEGLRTECVMARAKTTNQAAINGLDKLILICNWSLNLDRGLYLMGP